MCTNSYGSVVADVISVTTLEDGGYKRCLPLCRYLAGAECQVEELVKAGNE